MATLEELQTIIQTFTTQRMTAFQRKQAAHYFQKLAEEQLRLAEAEINVGHTVRQSAPTSAPATEGRGKGGRPKGSGALTVRWDSTGGTVTGSRRSGVLYIGRGLGLDTTMGAPARLDIQRNGNTLTLRPARGSDGYAVIRSGNGMPRISIGNEVSDILGLYDMTFVARGASDTNHCITFSLGTPSIPEPPPTTGLGQRWSYIEEED